MKNILITGGAGFLGQELTHQLLKLHPDNITIFSRDEATQWAMKHKIADKRISYVIGDVRDYESLLHATTNIDSVFHLAALKHVGICETQPDEAIKTNVDGTINLIKAAIANKVSRVVLMSTDKAVSPASLYGMTKGICERLFIQANSFSEYTTFNIIRTGNILGSSGSVTPLFIDMAKNGLALNVTDSTMTRFFLTAKEVADLLIYACIHGGKANIYIPVMNSFYIFDLAKVIANYYGVEIKETGAKPGEAKHELIISPHESPHTYENVDMYVISNDNLSLDKVNFTQMSSMDRLRGPDELYKMLIDINYL